MLFIVCGLALVRWKPLSSLDIAFTSLDTRTDSLESPTLVGNFLPFVEHLLSLVGHHKIHEESARAAKTLLDNRFKYIDNYDSYTNFETKGE